MAVPGQGKSFYYTQIFTSSDIFSKGKSQAYPYPTKRLELLQSIRNRRFATALSVLTNSTQSNFLAPDLMAMGQGMMMMNSYAPMGGKFIHSPLSPPRNVPQMTDF